MDKGSLCTMNSMCAMQGMGEGSGLGSRDLSGYFRRQQIPVLVLQGVAESYSNTPMDNCG